MSVGRPILQASRERQARTVQVARGRSELRAREQQDYDNGACVGEGGRDQHDAARGGKKGAAPQWICRALNARRGGGRARSSEPDPLSLWLQAGSSAGPLRVSQCSAARSSERSARRSVPQTLGTV